MTIQLYFGYGSVINPRTPLRGPETSLKMLINIGQVLSLPLSKRNFRVSDFIILKTHSEQILSQRQH